MASTVLYLAWQDQQSRSWFTIGRLRRMSDGMYEFVYVGGFKKAQDVAGLQPLIGFGEVDQRYLSHRLFPHYQNRVMSPKREDFADYIRRLGFDEPPSEPLEILARSEGHRVTDSLQVFPAPTMSQSDGRSICSLRFFIHGMRHVSPEAQQLQLDPGTRLFLLWDFQNPYDPHALMLRTETGHLLGWVPRFYCQDLLTLMKGEQRICVTVDRVNREPVPSWLRVICQLEAVCPEGFSPLHGPEFRPLAPHVDI